MELSGENLNSEIRPPLINKQVKFQINGNLCSGGIEMIVKNLEHVKVKIEK